MNWIILKDMMFSHDAMFSHACMTPYFHFFSQYNSRTYVRGYRVTIRVSEKGALERKVLWGTLARLHGTAQRNCDSSDRSHKHDLCSSFYVKV